MCPYCKGKGFFIKDVPVGHPDFGKLIPCQCKLKEMEKRRMAHLGRWTSLSYLKDMTFETFKPEGVGLSEELRRNLRLAYESALRFAQNPKGWLLIKGGYGSGKTHLAAAIANYRLQKGEPAIFIVVPDLLDYLRTTFSPGSQVDYDERFDELRNAPLLILDDLGAHSTTSWAREKLFQLLNHRYLARLPTVITTDLELEEIDPRLRSRLADPDVTEIITIKAPDYRQATSQGVSSLSALGLYRHMTFENFELRTDEVEMGPEERRNLREALRVAKEYARKPEGWLVIMGKTPGCGKTHLAAAIANHLASQGYQVIFVVVPDLLDYLRATFSPQSPVSYDRAFEEVRNAPFLVLDDLGTESATPWAKEKLYQLFNHRYVARLPTVITTSRDLEEIDPRIRFRMLDPAISTVFVLTVPEYLKGRR